MNSELQASSYRRWVLHDYMQVNGGAERLVSTIARCFPEFSLGVSGVYSGFSNSADMAGVHMEILGKIAKIVPRIPRAILTFSNRIPCIEQAETVIYSGVYSPLAVKMQRRGKRIYYCHTPPRFAFDRKQKYLEKIPFLMRPLLSFAIDRYRIEYQSCIHQMDYVLTNSEHTRKLIYQQLGIQAKVVYPPVNIEKYKWLAQGDYYLSLGRLEPNKRVDRIVKAFMTMPEKKLIVASGGSQLQLLRTMAAESKNIFFTGWVTEDELTKLIGNAISCIYIPYDEDFGMSAIESMSAGKPVIGVAEGGMIESVIDGSTGFLLPQNPQVEDICAAVRLMSAPLALSMRNRCELRASDFSEKRFVEQIESSI
jgi:glycosyltransferase involved in cell wall biosynthesis